MMAALVQRLDRHHHVRVAPFQRPGVPEAAGLAYAQAEAAAWTVGADGARYRGAAAINAALAAALGWPWLLRLYEVAWLGRVQDAVYDWVAAHRGRLPGITPYCDRPGADCRKG